MNVRRHRGIIWRWASLGLDEDDSPDLQLKKSVMTIVSTSIASLAIFWGSLYIYSGYPWAGAIPLSYSLISFSSTLHFFRTKRFGFFCFSQQLLILLLPFLLMWRLGGFANGSVVMIWGFFAPLAALFFIDLKAAARWMLAYIILLSFSAIFDHHFATLARPMPATLNTVYFVMNTGCGFTLIALALYYFVKDRERAYEQLRQNEIHIRELMLTDPLTGVPNRRHLDNRLAMELSRQTRYGQPLAIIMTDIDLFKRVNDSYGHAMGDKVLRDFAACLQENIRESDFLARFGGEEFVLLLPNSTEKEAQTMAERMRSAVKALHFEIPSLHITSSFGVTLTRQGEDMSAVLDRVDKAMYMSKTRGRDCVTLLRT
ncbi:MAG: GGDEF domain-containing protein [Gammaproteobacteria bacterium]